jgi:hypothetical protein
MNDAVIAQKRLEAKRRAAATRGLGSREYRNLVRNKREFHPLTAADRKRQSPRMKTVLVHTSEGK